MGEIRLMGLFSTGFLHHQSTRNVRYGVTVENIEHTSTTCSTVLQKFKQLYHFLHIVFKASLSNKSAYTLDLLTLEHIYFSAR
jgi:hypothetical protein